MINLEFKAPNGERLGMAYDVTAEENRSLTIPAGAVAIQVWLGTATALEDQETDDQSEMDSMNAEPDWRGDIPEE